ncbi:nitrous oxide-stimulated promoter family protein [Photobacterium phosphoreum]|uniref:nitrous oxide-stimulated promoter family protein n=1 Tax=Photobacterium phosphoreum TaxID=659 RepID=UPI000D16950C|nr:nitrous oxide-stimulated promoter family protein [Photobacterium phosphoreum]PSW33385.1 nitrous oxide-stimulated promoter family protein [Photobacterium phosphoreum]PTB33705.1 nitrous oxide-stimulated promoter family protein [Photobacterium phosphoreum]
MDKDANFHLFGQLNTEFNTITAMIDLYCLRHHQPNTGKFQHCADCEQFRTYVKQRLDRCPYGEKKPSCKQCPIHCYKPQQKLKSQTIMRYSGPKMLVKHPIMAIRHLIHDKRAVPERNKKMTSNYKTRKALLNKR